MLLFSVACPTKTTFSFLLFFFGGGGRGGICFFNNRGHFFCISNKYFYSDEYRDYRVLEGVSHVCVTAELLG